MNIKSYVISLERASERRRQALVEQERLGLPFQSIAAIDGAKSPSDFVLEGYSEEQGRKLRNIYGKRGLSRNEQACALSHLKVYRQIIEDGVDVAVVSEDDAVFLCNQDALLQAIRSLPDGWDVFYLYHRGDIERADNNLVSFRSVPGSAVSYVVTNAAARKLVDLASPLRLAADALLGRAVFIGLLEGYGAFPLLASHQDAGMSLLSGRVSSSRTVSIKGWLLSRSMLTRKLSFLFTKSNSYFCRLW